ncbi:Mitochondrial cardiolipin hydrolase [Armadillidium vulgare]|nr:Mitochondrial cardiolipin hydrolase [Armadillidium vulgare]
MLAPMLKLVYHSMSFIGIYFTIKLLYEYFNKKTDKKDKDWFHKVIFFPDQGICNSRDSHSQNAKQSSQILENECLFKDIRLPMNLRSNLDKSTALVYLLKFIKCSKKSLDLCLLIFTLSELQDAIIEAKRRGVTIRVIIDKTMSDCDGSCLPALQRENIPVLRGPSSMMVHHKFALAILKRIMTEWLLGYQLDMGSGNIKL